MKHLLSALIVCLLSSCGSIKNENPSATSAGIAAGSLNSVVVRDFTNAYPKGDAEVTARFAAKFADQIAAEISRLKPGVRVTRNGAASPSALVIGGEVTRCVEGNAALRMMIGMGAGSCYFDAKVRLADGSGKALSTILVDKNSWGLGGIMASAQTVDTFVTAGAKKTAEAAITYLK